MGDESAMDVLRLAADLEQRDVDVEQRLARVEDLVRQVDELRVRSGAISAELAALPHRLLDAQRVAETARGRRSAAGAELATAQERLEAAHRGRWSGEETREAAERALRRATVACDDAEHAVTRAQQAIDGLASDEIALEAGAAGVEAEAAVLAPLVAAVPRISDSGRAVPTLTLAGVREWSARAHAALFVVRGSLVGERDDLVAEAGGLAAAVLGEYPGGTSVALVRRRLERVLAGKG